MARKISMAALVKLADKGKKEDEPSYAFSKKTFKKKPAPPGQHVKAKS